MAADPELSCLTPLADGSLLLRLHVQPRAATNGLAGLAGDMLKVRLTTPPVDGQANKAVIAYLAKLFRLPKSALSIRSGLKNRSKTVQITGVELERIEAVLAAQLSPDER